MLRAFSSIWIVRAVVFLSHQKSWPDERESVDKNDTLLQWSSWRDACGYSRQSLGTPPLGAASGMVMETTMTKCLRYLYFHCTIKEFMLMTFSSICISRSVVFLLQQKSWQDRRKSVAGDLTEDIRVRICGVS